jgi:hypothetical protein
MTQLIKYLIYSKNSIYPQNCHLNEYFKVSVIDLTLILEKLILVRRIFQVINSKKVIKIRRNHYRNSKDISNWWSRVHRYKPCE